MSVDSIQHQPPQLTLTIEFSLAGDKLQFLPFAFYFFTNNKLFSFFIDVNDLSSDCGVSGLICATT